MATLWVLDRGGGPIQQVKLATLVVFGFCFVHRKLPLQRYGPSIHHVLCRGYEGVFEEPRKLSCMKIASNDSNATENDGQYVRKTAPFLSFLMIWVKGQSLIPRGAIFDAFRCIKDSIFGIKSEFPNTGILSKKKSNNKFTQKKTHVQKKKNVQFQSDSPCFFHKKKSFGSSDFLQ